MALFRYLRARGGSESVYGSAWFGAVWGGILGGIAIAGSHARGIFPHTERVLPRSYTRTPFSY
jgi:hypothetical protein